MTTEGLLTTEKEKKKRKKKSKAKVYFQKLEPFLYLLPFIIAVGIFTVYPIINVFSISFKEGYNQLTGNFEGFGIENYKAVLSDGYFHSAVKNTFQYVITVVPISTCIALLFSALLNNKIRFSSIFQTAFFLPMVTSVTAVGLAWKWMYNLDYGIINYFISSLGLKPVGWLTDQAWGMAALSIYGIWSMLPFTIILLLAGMQGINPDYYTAAKVDGAKTRHLFFRITLPLLSPTIGLVLILNMINAFKVFNEMFPLFNGKPGVAYTLNTVVYYIYDMFQIKWKLGYASAASIILFLIIFFFTMIQLGVQKKWKN